MAEAFVKEKIKGSKVVIFSKTYCPFCKMSKSAFKALKEPVTVVELDERDDGEAIQDVLNVMTGSRTVPKTFIRGKCYGGGTDIKKLHESGELETILKE